jgi:two-component system, chemotaxis family, response regulator Rcp1
MAHLDLPSWGKYKTVAQSLEILLVEDSPADAHLTLEALRDPRTVCHLVEDAVEALRFLRRNSPHDAAPRPDIILLDLNLPGMDGKELLVEIKNDELLRDIPVVVLSSSANPDDISYAYSHHAACYITKSTHLDQYMTAVRTLKELWFHTASFPKKATAAQTAI